MDSDQWEKIRDELEIIKNTAEYGIDCVDNDDELKEILQDIKRSYGRIAHTINEH